MSSDVSAVHGVASLEGNDAAPSEAGKLRAQFGGSEAQRAEIVMRRCLQTFDASADVPRVRLVHGVVCARVGLAGAIENCLGFGSAVGLPNFFYVQNGEHDTLGIAERDFAAAGRQFLGKFFRDIERDRHGPENSAGQMHVVTDTVVVGFVHEAVQRRKASAHQKFKIANLPGGKIPGWPLARMGFQFRGLFRSRNQIDKFSAVRSDQMTSRSGQACEPPRFVEF